MPAKEQKRAERYSVFLNIPYDSAFENLYLAYIAGLSAFGLIPRATLEIPTSQRRLERILKLLQQCAYSIHDLSRVQLDAKLPRCRGSICHLNWVLPSPRVPRIEGRLGPSARPCRTESTSRLAI